MRDVLVCWWVQGPLGILIITWPHNYAVFSPEKRNSLQQVTNVYLLSYDTNMSSEHQSTYFVYNLCNSTTSKALYIFSVLICDYNSLESKQIPMPLVTKKAHFTQSYQQNPLCHNCNSYAVTKTRQCSKILITSMPSNRLLITCVCPYPPPPLFICLNVIKEHKTTCCKTQILDPHEWNLLALQPLLLVHFIICTMLSNDEMNQTSTVWIFFTHPLSLLPHVNKMYLPQAVQLYYTQFTHLSDIYSVDFAHRMWTFLGNVDVTCFALLYSPSLANFMQHTFFFTN